MTLYAQTLDAGYSAPGLATLTDTEHVGGTFRMPVTDRLERRGQGRPADPEAGAGDDARIEIDVGLPADRRLEREHRRAQRSARGPLAGRPAHAGAGRAHGRRRAGRLRFGRVLARLRLRAGHAVEGRRPRGQRPRSAPAARTASPTASGSTRKSPTATWGPAAGSAPTTCMSERTNLYLNYALENERTDNGLLRASRQPGLGREEAAVGQRAACTSRSATRTPTRSPDSRTPRASTWSRTSAGTSAPTPTSARCTDSLTGAETDRKAGGVRVGYGYDSIQVSSAVEYRMDETEQLDTSITERTTWLFRNNFKYQLNAGLARDRQAQPLGQRQLARASSTTAGTPRRWSATPTVR